MQKLERLETLNFKKFCPMNNIETTIDFTTVEMDSNL